MIDYRVGAIQPEWVTQYYRGGLYGAVQIVYPALSFDWAILAARQILCGDYGNAPTPTGRDLLAQSNPIGLSSMGAVQFLQPNHIWLDSIGFLATLQAKPYWETYSMESNTSFFAQILMDIGRFFCRDSNPYRLGVVNPIEFLHMGACKPSTIFDDPTYRNSNLWGNTD